MAYYYSGKSISDVPEADNSIINTLLYGIKWEISSVGTAINLTYSFPWTTNSTAQWTIDYYPDGEPYATTSGLSSTQMIAAISAMQSWANVANITFTEVVESGDEVGDIRFAFSSAVEDAWGWSYLPNEYAFAGDIWISPDNDSDFSVGSYNYMALIHELGHSLGLKHPGYYGEGDEAPFLPYSTDNKQYSVMSYHDAFGNRMYESQPYYRYMWADEGTGYYVVPEAKTPMVYDILAMQYLYGANMSYHNTDDTYLFDENIAPFLMTIWDGGGNDTISVVGSVNSSIIDLNEGAYSVIQTSRFRGYDTISDKYVDNMYNLGIAYGAIIENAIGGEVNDTLTGNQYNNILEGRGGDDTIDGGAGNDTIDGGAGNDTASYQSSTLGVVVDLSKTTAQNTIGAGTDTLTNIENLTGSKYNDILIGNSENNILNGGAGIDTISYKNSTTGVTVNLATITAQNTVGAGTDTISNFENIIGSDYNDTLTGNSSNNVLEGGLGNDIINGGTGIDSVTYENSTVGVSVNLTLTSAQTIQGTEKDIITGVENLIGSDHDDILIGNSSANTINGNGGNDTLDGGAGNDILNGGDGVDTLSYATATAAIKVNLSTTSAQATGGSGTDTVSNFENLIGSKYNDTLTGNDSNNTIDGGVGNDIIEGGLDNDTLIGGVGIDTISYATSSQAISIDLSIEDAQDTIGAGMDTITDFENITGSNYDDTLKGNALNNIILAGLGNDILNGGLGNDTLDGGVGIDTASYEYSNVGVTVNLALTSAQTIQGTEKDTIKNIENLTGSDYNDILKGSTLSNAINGLDGNDTIIAGTGKTNDIFDGGDGIDTISYEQATSLVTIDLSNTSSQVTTGSGSDTITGFENLTGSKYNDTLNGDSNNNIILGGAGNDTINGNGGNDTLDGGAGNDILNGGDGVDTLSYATATAAIKVNLSTTSAQATGGSGTDTVSNFENLIGSKYNDTLTGNDSNNTIDGGVGNDIIEGGLDNDTLIGGVGIDTISYATSSQAISIDLSIEDAQDTIGAGMDTITDFENITGSNYDDTLKGNALNNIILAGLGNDILNGGLGNDTLDGGVGIDTASYEYSNVGVTVNLALTSAQTIQGTEKDTIKNIENLTGSDYNDILKGSTLSNAINGLDGNDTIIAGTGKTNDIFDGGDGIDTISYEQATSLVTIDLSNTSSQVTTGSGSDTITGFENLTGSKYNDTLNGDSNNNIILGGAGNDTINGNGGNDTLDGGAGNDILNGGDGVDTLSYATATAAIKVNLSTTSAQATGGSGTDTVSNFENLIGSKYNDTLTGNDSNNTIDGGVGNDIIEGGLDNDTLIGGVGIDTISYATSSQAISIDLSIEDAQDTIGAGMDTITDFENITGSNYDDTLKGNALNNIILAGLGNDILNGGLGNDTLDGGVGIDTASYEYSNVGVTVNLALTSAQTIQGTEKDTIKNIENLTGSDYNDILKGSTLSNAINGLDGNDTIIAGTGKTNDIFDGGDGIDTISYEQATSLVTIDLSNTSSQVTTGSGSDTITGFENLTGSKYNDTLNGDSNSNIIIGGAGNDTINGNGGNDTLDGGAGNDIFIFDQALSIDNIDTILNFSSVYDTIKIDDSIFDVFTNLGTILQGNLFSSIDGSASDGDDYILYNTTTGELSYDNDGSGSSVALVFATLGTTTHPTISYTDFVVI